MEANEFKEVFMPHHKLLYNIALRISGNAPDAEDLVQETYIRLWKQRKSLTSLSNARSYAVTTLRHVCYDALSSRPPDGTVTGFDSSMAEPTDDRDTDTYIERHETSELLGKLIAGLPSPQREVITMRDIEDMSFDRITQITGLTQGNVRIILFRARRKIKELFKCYSRL